MTEVLEYCDGKVIITLELGYYLERVEVKKRYRKSGLVRCALLEFEEDVKIDVPEGEEETYVTSVVLFLVPAFKSAGWVFSDKFIEVQDIGFELKEGWYDNEERFVPEYLQPMKKIMRG